MKNTVTKKLPLKFRESKVKDTFGNPATKETTEETTIEADGHTSHYKRHIRIAADHTPDVVDTEKVYEYTVTSAKDHWGSPDPLQYCVKGRDGESKLYSSLKKAQAMLERAALSDQFLSDATVQWAIVRESVTIYKEEGSGYHRSYNLPITKRPAGSKTISGYGIYWG